MASKKYEKDSPERMFMAELYSFTEKYFIPENTDSYWDHLVDDAIQLTDRYESVRFAPIMVMDFITYLEREAKSKGIPPRYKIKCERIN